MPLKLVPPRTGQSSNWRIRGTYLKQTVDRSTGTGDQRVAAKALSALKREIEVGRFRPADAPTFASAAADYERAGGKCGFLTPLVKAIGSLPLDQIDQRTVDRVAALIKPDGEKGGTAATRNRQVYTPVSAVLRHAKIKLDLKRPKGAKGTPRTAYLREQDAFALLAAADQINPKFGVLLTFLLYTGCRLSEALRLRCEDVKLVDATVYIRQTKTEGARTAHMPPALVAAMANLKAGLDRPGKRVFGLTKSGYVYNMLKETVIAANAAEWAYAKRAGEKVRFVIVIPERVKFHLFRHTWATWMRKFAGMDTAALVETGAWRSREAAAVYEHMDATEEARKTDLLPVAPEPQNAEIRVKPVVVPMRKA